jgi:hypothetical protein
MKALTVWQPWATLIAIGAKPYEFRGWQPPRSLLGQRLAIHAGARSVKVAEVRALVRALKGDPSMSNPCLHQDLALPALEKVLAGLEATKQAGPLFGGPDAFTLPLSHVLCTVTLGSPKRGDMCAAEFGLDAGNDSAREGTFNWGWPMRDIEPLVPPIPARGAQGLWEWRP